MTDKKDSAVYSSYGNEVIPNQYPQSVGCPYQIKEPFIDQVAREARETLGIHIETINSPNRLTTKDTNPKDACGTAKVPMSTVSGPVILEVGLAMFEGARKYGRHNYRVAGVRASVYYDAAMRHLIAWYEGQDTDPDSGMSHITKAMASLAVLRDAQINNKCVDDRPPKCNEDFVKRLNQMAGELLKKYPESPNAYTEENNNK